MRLGVNVDHVATLRNARGENFPDPVEAAKLALASGADGITAHLREDRRHIKDEDMRRLRELPAPLNFEMAVTEEMVSIVEKLKPAACCLVPEKRQEITTEGGLDVVGRRDTIQESVARLTDAGVKVSLFIDPSPEAIETAKFIGAPAVELHTGAYARGKEGELERLRKAVTLGKDLGLHIHAGHGLTYDNLNPIIEMKDIEELNIGFFLISEAIFHGLGPVVRKMKDMMNP